MELLERIEATNGCNAACRCSPSRWRRCPVPTHPSFSLCTGTRSCARSSSSWRARSRFPSSPCPARRCSSTSAGKTSSRSTAQRWKRPGSWAPGTSLAPSVLRACGLGPIPRKPSNACKPSARFPYGVARRPGGGGGRARRRRPDRRGCAPRLSHVDVPPGARRHLEGGRGRRDAASPTAPANRLVRSRRYRLRGDRRAAHRLSLRCAAAPHRRTERAASERTSPRRRIHHAQRRRLRLRAVWRLASGRCVHALKSATSARIISTR